MSSTKWGQEVLELYGIESFATGERVAGLKALKNIGLKGKTKKFSEKTPVECSSKAPDFMRGEKEVFSKKKDMKKLKLIDGNEIQRGINQDSDKREG